MPAHPTPDVPDDELVARARGGDRVAYGELVRRHQGAALRVAAGICGSTEEARDIVQDALVQGYRSLDRYRGDAPVRSWLLRIVANHAKNAVRAGARRRGREDRFVALHRTGQLADPTADNAGAGEEAATLLRVLVGLPLADREVLACRYVAGLTEAETAAALQVPIGTVKSRSARALARARRLLETAEVARG